MMPQDDVVAVYREAFESARQQMLGAWRVLSLNGVAREEDAHDTACTMRQIMQVSVTDDT